MKSGVFPARLLTPPPIRLPASQPPELRQIVYKWLESRRTQLFETGKLSRAESFRAYANNGAAVDRSTYSLKLAFDGLNKLYEGEELLQKAFSILDHMIKNDIAPFGLGPLMQRTFAVMKTAQPIGIPALLVDCFKAA
jgi:hypothetical protein